MEELLTTLGFAGIAAMAVLAHLAWDHRWAWWVFTVILWLYGILSLALTGLCVFVLGIMLLQPEILGQLDADLKGPFTSLEIFGWISLILVLITLFTFLVLIPPTRRWLFKALPASPQSPPHQLAVVLIILFYGYFVLQLVLYDVEFLIRMLQDSDIFLNLVIFQGGLILLTLTGCGLFLRRNWRQVGSRLGIRKLTLIETGQVVGIGLTFFAASALLDEFIVRQLAPEVYENLSRIHEAMLSNQTQMSVLGIVLMFALVPAICEELFFRGLLQPILGLVPTALFFTVIHFHYGLTPAMLLIFILAMVLGWMRERYGLVATMIVHFMNNFLAAVVMPFIMKSFQG